MVDIVPGALIVSKDNHFTAIVIGVSMGEGDLGALGSTLSVIVDARGGPYSSGFFPEWCTTSIVHHLFVDGELIIVLPSYQNDLPAPGSREGEVRQKLSKGSQCAPRVESESESPCAGS